MKDLSARLRLFIDFRPSKTSLSAGGRQASSSRVLLRGLAYSALPAGVSVFSENQQSNVLLRGKEIHRKMA